MSRFQAIVFDCDGVLIDSEIINNRVEAEIKTELGFPITLEEQIRKFVGLGAGHPVIQAELQKLPKDYLDQVDQRIKKIYPNELKAVEGVREFLEANRL